MKSKSDSPAQSDKKYPTFIRLDEDDLPELKKWKVGGKYTLTVEVEQTSMSMGDEYGEIENKNKNKHRASFKVLNVSALGSVKEPSAVASALKRRV